MNLLTLHVDTKQCWSFWTSSNPDSIAENGLVSYQEQVLRSGTIGIDQYVAERMKEAKKKHDVT